MSFKLTITGALFILLAIVLGAMAAHALEQKISANLIETFEKGVKYQMYVGLGLLIVGLNADRFPFRLTAFYYFNVFGVLLFSGAIYAYSLYELIPALRPAAMVVPFGGTAMIIGWILLIIKLIGTKKK